MLTADLVHARRRGTELQLLSLNDDGRRRALELAAALLDIAQHHVGSSQEEFEAAVSAVDAEARDARLRDGLAKLIEDRCTFDAPEGPDPEELRREVFGRASALRAELPAGEKLDRVAVLDAVAEARGVTRELVEGALFADLRGAQVLQSFEPIDAAALVLAHERGQAQAVLLRAVKITVDLEASSVAVTRAFFRKLKFLRLLYAITKTETGFRVVIDGPFSLFESVTKYGLQLALVLPALEECEAWKLEADIRWGKEKLPLVFRLAGGSTAPAGRKREPALPDEVSALLKSFANLESAWKAKANQAILDLPGAGLTIPDLVFERPAASPGPRDRIYLEVMGYWSRAAVWQRVELARAGLKERVLFAVSSRLRVSEEVLKDDESSALYVYKGTMNARAILTRLDAMAG